MSCSAILRMACPGLQLQQLRLQTAHLGLQGGAGFSYRRLPKLVLGGKVVMNQGLGHAGLTGNVSNAGATETVARKHVQRSLAYGTHGIYSRFRRPARTALHQGC